MPINKFLRILVVLFFIGVLTPGKNAFAAHILPRNEYNCSTDFPCPDKLHGRIDFWVAVFSKWGKEKAIFHDSEVPDRVYSVINTGKGCSHRVSKKVKRERAQLKKLFGRVLKKVSEKKPLNQKEQHIAELFDYSTKKIKLGTRSIRCQSGVKDSYIAGLERFNKYSFMVDNILQQHGLPNDIRYLPFVESSYNPSAYSKAGAAGMWQIMPRTARVLGLELNAAIDERLEPEASTRAAVKYLVDARQSISDLARSIDPDITDAEIYPFVITSYNYGVNGMKNAIRKVRPDYIEVINNYKSPRFQIAVKNFYASFLAARHIATNASKFFGELKLESSPRYNIYTLEVDTSIRRIEKIFKVNEAQLKLLNLGLTRFVWRGWRLVPAGYRVHLPYRADGYQAAIDELRVLPVETVAPSSRDYVVRKGDTACGIARALRVNCAELIRFNGLNKRATIIVGQKLSIPGKVVLVASNTAKKIGSATSIRSSFTNTVYRVRRGDSACLIAKKFNVSCRQLIRVNVLGRKAIIQIGQRLIIPGHTSIGRRNAILDENNRYIVRKGDALCRIAKRLSTSCNALRRFNNLDKKAVIHPGQRLLVPGYQLPDSSVTAEQLAGSTSNTSGMNDVGDSNNVGQQTKLDAQRGSILTNLLDVLPDLSVSVSGDMDNPQYSTIVEADETLGHYADWIGLSSTQPIRKLNGLGKKSNIIIGQRIKLPIKSGDVVPLFEQKRTDFHQVLSESLKEHFILTAINDYTVEKGDSAWDIAKTQGFPLWLLYRINPKLKAGQIQAGQVIKVPVLQAI